MAENEKEYPLDLEGHQYVTDALVDTLNSYPGLYPGEKFKFSTTNLDDGLNVAATSGAVIVEEIESITGHVTQMCAYPFMVILRASGLSNERKIETKEWMDTLAEWMTRKAVTIGGEVYHMKKWPVLSGDREIRKIIRNTPAYLAEITEDKAESWAMDLTIQYRQEFDR